MGHTIVYAEAMQIRDWVYRLYARSLRRRLDEKMLPRHVAVVMDGNRRWARQMGFDNPGIGHRYGARHLEDLLEWCAGLGIDHVTVYVASSDNLCGRGKDEVAHLMDMVEQVIADHLTRPSNRWRLHIAGRLEDVPDSTAHALKTARDDTAERDGGHLTVAIGYDGQQEIVAAVRSLLEREAAAGADIADLAQRLSAEDIAPHLYTAGLPDPELIIRTSGEHRLSSFLIWQAARAELYFCDVYWPGFRYIDFLRALRTYAARRR